MNIWVDADACPVKGEIERLAGRRGFAVIHVCALEGFRRDLPGVEVITVAKGPDAVDDLIIERCAEGDLVVTSDVPLAVEAIRKGALVVDFRGQEMTPETMPLRSGLRDLAMARHDRGEMIRGPKPMTATARRDFTQAFGRILDRLVHAANVRAKRALLEPPEI